MTIFHLTIISIRENFFGDKNKDKQLLFKEILMKNNIIFLFFFTYLKDHLINKKIDRPRSNKSRRFEKNKFLLVSYIVLILV